jgi:sulfur carrier protein ThiS adenylyltransferase
MPDDIGKPKVEAVGEMMRRMNPEVRLTAHARRFTTADTSHTVLFCCVDSIEVRQHVWENVAVHTPVYIDGRMAAEVLRVITSCDQASRDYYPETLFSDAEAFEGACTARSTIFTANIAAGVMVEQYSKWLREMPMDRDTIFNLLSMEIFIP